MSARDPQLAWPWRGDPAPVDRGLALAYGATRNPRAMRARRTLAMVHALTFSHVVASSPKARRRVAKTLDAARCSPAEAPRPKQPKRGKHDGGNVFVEAVTP